MDVSSDRIVNHSADCGVLNLLTSIFLTFSNCKWMLKINDGYCWGRVLLKPAKHQIPLASKTVE